MEGHADVSREDVEYLRARVHKLADVTQANASSIAELKLTTANLAGQLAGLASSSATSQQLEYAVELLTVKLGHLHEDLSLIKRAIYWASGIVIGGIILAVLALVVRM